VWDEPAVLPDRAIRRQSHYFIYRPRIRLLIWRSLNAEHYNYSPLRCDVAQYGRLAPILWRDCLYLCPAWEKTEVTGSYEMLVVIYQTRWHHWPDDCNLLSSSR